ncbi:MAG: hypothetical protein RsTaC01_0958 [Candidatus Paraimprobicoccus trichonymphae]|uniref:Uncharacterized protein n=1 Tax=Candidatus Paraimprobicoccus trichonymphae TaxID=3033793 RepID=A0AA48HX55_9FIRM|nr:MAG: hypothetical protein RsTaC01_0958 [Candidatus Paraimprobicoccus trichonymphae]
MDIQKDFLKWSSAVALPIIAVATFGNFAINLVRGGKDKSPSTHVSSFSSGCSFQITTDNIMYHVRDLVVSGATEKQIQNLINRCNPNYGNVVAVDNFESTQKSKEALNDYVFVVIISKKDEDAFGSSPAGKEIFSGAAKMDGSYHIWGYKNDGTFEHKVLVINNGNDGNVDDANYALSD